MTKERKIIYGCVLALVAVLFVIGGIFDLSISQAAYQPNNVMAKVMQCVGPFPPFVIVAATFALLFFSLDETKKALVFKKLICVGAVVASYLLFGFVGSEAYLEKLLFRILAGVGAAVVLTPITFFALRNIAEEKRKRLLLLFVFGSVVAVISSLISVNVLKFIWGRPRYYEMDATGSFDAFSPWFKINGFSLHGHHSFPSGHVCAASNLFAFCAFGEVFPSSKRREVRVAFIAVLYTFIMAYSRIVLGAHFLSDVTGGFFIGFLTYAVARYFFFKRFGGAFAELETVVEDPRGVWDDPEDAGALERVEIDFVSDGTTEAGFVEAEILTDPLEAQDEVEIEKSEAVEIILSSEEDETDEGEEERGEDEE